MIPESPLVTDANLDVILGHLTLEALLEGEDGGVHGVIKLEVLGVPFLKERLPVVLAHGGRLPGKVGSAGVALNAGTGEAYRTRAQIRATLYTSWAVGIFS